MTKHDGAPADNAGAPHHVSVEIAKLLDERGLTLDTLYRVSEFGHAFFRSLMAGEVDLDPVEHKTAIRRMSAYLRVETRYLVNAQRAYTDRSAKSRELQH